MTDPTTPDRPTSAGMYDFYLGGTAHSPADRAAAEKITEMMPEIPDGASANRGFLQRAVGRMATDWGIRQFIDIGSGLPTQRNTHDVVAEAIPDGRVLYVDLDPVVVARGTEILASAENATAASGRSASGARDQAAGPGVAVIQGDVRQPDAILGHPQARRLIDLSAPVGLLLVAVLHFVPDDDDPWGLVGRYMSRMVSGSYLALTHSAVGDQTGGEVLNVGTKIYSGTATPWTDRSRTEIERLFTGLDIVPAYPGAAPELVFIGAWGAEDPELADSEGSRLGYAAVARTP
ncbi:MAG: SAM-dependent methyltransferase [Natronosporangium sp.]